MSKKEFKPGDRVAVYGYDDDNRRWYEGAKGIVVESPYGYDVAVEVKFSDSGGRQSYFYVHQLRRLVKKPRREFWINTDAFGFTSTHSSRERADNNASTRRIECIHAREVLPKKGKEGEKK
jgi:hypothetical protein